MLERIEWLFCPRLISPLIENFRFVCIFFSQFVLPLKILFFVPLQAIWANFDRN